MVVQGIKCQWYQEENGSDEKKVIELEKKNIEQFISCCLRNSFRLKSP